MIPTKLARHSLSGAFNQLLEKLLPEKATTAKRETEIVSLLESIMQQELKQQDDKAHLECQLELATKTMEEMKKTHEEELESKVDELRKGMRKKAIKRQQFLEAEIKQLNEQLDEMDELIVSKEKEIKMLKASTLRSAAEIGKLQKHPSYQEQNYKDELMSLKHQLEVATKKMEAMKRTHKQELEAKAAQLRNGMPKAKNENLQFLKSEVKRHRRAAEEHLIAYWEKDSALTKERQKTAELQKKVEELEKKQAENARNSVTASRGKEGAAPVTVLRISKVTGVDDTGKRDHLRKIILRPIKPQKEKFN